MDWETLIWWAKHVDSGCLFQIAFSPFFYPTIIQIKSRKWLKSKQAIHKKTVAKSLWLTNLGNVLYMYYFLCCKGQVQAKKWQYYLKGFRNLFMWIWFAYLIIVRPNL